MRYFFDSRDNDKFLRDDEGLEFANLEVVKDESARALAELARDVLPGSTHRALAIQVRDEGGRPIMITTIAFVVVPVV